MPGPDAVEARYAPGAGVLLGGGARWLLIDLPDLAAADDARLERLWELVTGPATAPARVLAVVAQEVGECSLVLADLTAAAPTVLTRGSGRAEATEHGRVLHLGDGAPPCTRRIASGVVAAAGVELRTSPASGSDGPAAAPTTGLIDRIPPEILAPPPAPDVPEAATTPPPRTPATPATPSSPPTSPPRAGLPPAPFSQRPGGGAGAALADVQHTVRRAAAPGPAPVDHLQQGTQETVLAVHCEHGHVTPASTASCRVCGAAVPPQEPQRVPRPRLGTLHLPDGEQVALDRGVVFGRQPTAMPGGEDWPQLVRLPDDQTYVSRNHLHVELDGWLVLATDLGSRGGTTLRVAGRAPERIRAGERYIWEPGQVLDLADGYEILFTVT